VKEFKKKNKSTTVPATRKNKPVAKITNPFAAFQDEEPEQEPTVAEPVPVVEPVVQKPEQEPVRTPEQEPLVQTPEEPAEPVDNSKVIHKATEKVRSTYPKWKKALKTRDAYEEDSKKWQKHDKKAARIRQTIRDNFNNLLRFHKENQIVEALAQKYGNHVWRDLKEICPMFDFVREFPEPEDPVPEQEPAVAQPAPMLVEPAPVVEIPGMVEVGAPQIRQPVVRESEVSWSRSVGPTSTSLFSGPTEIQNQYAMPYVCCTWLHCEKSREQHAHDFVGELASGQVIKVAEIIGNRARIVSPMQGWITINDYLGNARIVPSKDMTLEYTTTTVVCALAGQAYDSAFVAYIPSGEVVQVAEIQGIRARVVSPVRGWISTKNIDNEDLIVQVQTNRKWARSLSQEQDSSSQSSQSVGRSFASRSGSIASRSGSIRSRL